MLRPYKTQFDFINENFPGSVQTQVTGINNRVGFGFERAFRGEDQTDDHWRNRAGTTVGFWSDMNNQNMVNNNFGFVK